MNDGLGFNGRWGKLGIKEEFRHEQSEVKCSDFLIAGNQGFSTVDLDLS